MTSSFEKILVPVDFTHNTDAAISHALALSDNERTEIHLLHVLRNDTKKYTIPVSNSYVMTTVLFGSGEKIIFEKLARIKDNIRAIKSGVRVFIHINSEGLIQNNIIQKALELETDLIIIGKIHGHSWLTFLNSVNANMIAAKTNCAVLQVQNDANFRKIGAVIVPFKNKVCDRKIDLLQALTHKQKPTIHLITIVDNSARENDPNGFANTFRTLSDYLHYPVNVKVMQASGAGKEMFNYAIDIDAGLIIVDPLDYDARGFSIYNRRFARSGLSLLFVSATDMKYHYQSELV